MSVLNIDSKIRIGSTSGNDVCANTQVGQSVVSLQDIPITNGISTEYTIPANSSKEIIDTRIPLNSNNTTQYKISVPIAANELLYRVEYNAGSAPQFKPLRSISTLATTSITITRINSTIVRISGIPSTSQVLVNDLLLIESNTDAFTSPFAVTNQGIFPISNVGPDYVDVKTQQMQSELVLLGADFGINFKILGQSGVKNGDIALIDSTYCTIVKVTDTYIDVTTSDLVPGIFGNIVSVYNRLINFLSLQTSNKCTLILNDSSRDMIPINSSTSFLVTTERTDSLVIINPNDIPMYVSILCGTI